MNKNYSTIKYNECQDKSYLNSIILKDINAVFGG